MYDKRDSNIAIISCTHDSLISTNYILIIIEGGRLQTHGNHEILFSIECFLPKQCSTQQPLLLALFVDGESEPIPFARLCFRYFAKMFCMAKVIAIIPCTYDLFISTNYILIIIEGGRLQTHGNHEILFSIECFLLKQCNTKIKLAVIKWYNSSYVEIFPSVSRCQHQHWHRHCRNSIFSLRDNLWKYLCQVHLSNLSYT